MVLSPCQNVQNRRKQAIQLKKVVDISWCLLSGKNSDRPFDPDGGGMSLLSLEEDTNGFQLCTWIPFTKKAPSTPPYKIN
ncbi:hypothetical protein ACSQ67_016909 [Phaseolus vulgaris]